MPSEIYSITLISYNISVLTRNIVMPLWLVQSVRLVISGRGYTHMVPSGLVPGGGACCVLAYTP